MGIDFGTLSSVLSIVITMISLGIIYGTIRTEMKQANKNIEQLQEGQKLIYSVYKDCAEMKVELQYHDKRISKLEGKE